MLVHALVTTIGTSPEPSVLLVLHSVDEVLANLFGRRTRVAVLAENHLAEFFFIPIIHSILLLPCFFLLLLVPGIGVQVLLGRLALGVQVMTELALAALFTVALLVENTDNCLGIDTKRNLLDLDGLEQLCGFLLGLLRSLLFRRNTSLLGFLSPCIRSFVGLILDLHLGDLSLGLSTFFLYRLLVRGLGSIQCQIDMVRYIRFSYQRSISENEC